MDGKWTCISIVCLRSTNHSKRTDCREAAEQGASYSSGAIWGSVSRSRIDRVSQMVKNQLMPVCENSYCI